MFSSLNLLKNCIISVKFVWLTKNGKEITHERVCERNSSVCFNFCGWQQFCYLYPLIIRKTVACISIKQKVKVLSLTRALSLSLVIKSLTLFPVPFSKDDRL